MSYIGSPSGVHDNTGSVSGARAGFWRRFAGSLLDGIIVGLINGILAALFKGLLADLLGLLVSFTYLTVLIGGPRGQTLGQQALGIRVISLDTGGSIGYGRAFGRIFAGYLSVIVVFLGYFWMLWDKEKQCWHDKLVGDIVVPVSNY